MFDEDDIDDYSTDDTEDPPGLLDGCEEIYAGESDDPDYDLDMGSPTDFDEYEMNADDCAPDPCDPFDMEYDR